VLAASQETNRWDGNLKASVFPDVRSSSPLSSTGELPPGVRRDRENLPQFTGNKRKYLTELKARSEEDERRLFYVATTRAKQRLYCTAAHWYGIDEKKGPSAFWSEVADQSDLVESVRNDEPSEANPVLDAMTADLVWPLAQPRLDDEGMGWLELVDRLRAGGDAEAVLDAANADARELLAEHVRVIDALRAHTGQAQPPPPKRRTFAATAAVRAAAGTEAIEEILHPLPQRPTEAQRLGVEVHAWIEELHRGLIGLAEEGEIDEASLTPDRATVAALKANFAALGFEKRVPFELPGGEPATEVPFMLKVPTADGDVVVRGRIDAVYEAAEAKDGGPSLEIVDFKTGMEPADIDWSQLELYAEALAALGLLDGDAVLTFAFLKTGTPQTKRYSPRGLAWLAEGLARAV
jgi:DNA helicase-2/ATP-dependent DNA helicase PcrA